jgi:hypothetical protein
MGEAVGWCLHILSEAARGAEDPHLASVDIDCWGPDRSLPEVMKMAYEHVSARAQARGLSYVQSRDLLIWARVGVVIGAPKETPGGSRIVSKSGEDEQLRECPARVRAARAYICRAE